MIGFDLLTLFFSDPFLFIISGSFLVTVFYFLFVVIKLFFDEEGEKDASKNENE